MASFEEMDDQDEARKRKRRSGGDGKRRKKDEDVTGDRARLMQRIRMSG